MTDPILCPECGSYKIQVHGTADVTHVQDQNGDWDLIEESVFEEDNELFCQKCNHKWEKK